MQAAYIRDAEVVQSEDISWRLVYLSHTKDKASVDPNLTSKIGQTADRELPTFYSY